MNGDIRAERNGKRTKQNNQRRINFFSPFFFLFRYIKERGGEIKLIFRENSRGEKKNLFDSRNYFFSPQENENTLRLLFFLKTVFRLKKKMAETNITCFGNRK